MTLAESRGPAVPADVAAFDLTDLDNFAHGFPHQAFVRHRAAVPIYWHEPTEHTPDGDGFWSVATHGLSLAVMRDPITFSSERGGDRAAGGTILPDSPAAGNTLNMMDDPRHQRIRALVSRGLTPKAIAALEPELVERVQPLVATAAASSEFDFLTMIAAELPLQVICVLLGVDEADRHQLLEWVEAVFDFGDARAATSYDTSLAQNAGAMFGFANELIATKRARPTNDMLSTVIHARMDDANPPQLTDAELASFFALLFAAGADTTRNAAAGGLLAMIEAPEQWERLRADRSLLRTAVDESVRWTAPSAYNRRTVTRPVEFAGCAMEPGDKVVFWEASANRDETVFVDSMRFDVGRDPNPHVGFGHGIHHCLGAALARLELQVMFTAMLDAFDRLELAGPVEWARSNKHTGIRHLPVRHVR